MRTTVSKLVSETSMLSGSVGDTEPAPIAPRAATQFLMSYVDQYLPTLLSPVTPYAPLFWSSWGSSVSCSASASSAKPRIACGLTLSP